MIRPSPITVAAITSILLSALVYKNEIANPLCASPQDCRSSMYPSVPLWGSGMTTHEQTTKTTVPA